MGGIQAGDDGKRELVMEGQHLTTAEEAERMLVADPAHRYRVMHEEGIVAECIFPTIVHPIGIHNVSYTGPEALMWGSDYPHHEGTNPHSQQTVARLAEGLDRAIADRVFRQNAVELFHFDESVLEQPLATD